MKSCCIFLVCFIFSFAWAKKRVLVIDASPSEIKELCRPYLSQLYDFNYYFVKESEQGNRGKNIKTILKDVQSKYKKKDLDGVISTQDYVGNICATIIAKKYRLPGPTPQAVLTCQHKYYSRQAQRRFVPEATPQFGLISPDDIEESVKKLSFTYPFFVKPVKAYFSFGATKIVSQQELEKQFLHLLPGEDFSAFLQDALKQYTRYVPKTRCLLAEDILHGEQITIEGFVKDGKVFIVGIVDSIMYPGTICFEHFEYPSALPKNIQNRMAKIAEKFVRGIKFNNSFFNIEMMYNKATDQIHIIEVNPRSAAQFTDLYEKVDGVNSYATMLALATNCPLPEQKKKKGRYGVAASFAMRVFEDGCVKKVPSQQEVEHITYLLPDTRIRIHVHAGKKLSDELQDGKSYLYAVANMGGKNKQDLLERFARCKELLTFDIAPQ